MNAATTAEGSVRPEATTSTITWVSQRTVLDILSTHVVRLNELVVQGKVRRRQIAGTNMRARYCLEDALALR